MFDKPKESKTKFRSQSKSSKSSKPAALGKAPTSASTGALSTSRASSSTSSDTQTDILSILQIIRSDRKRPTVVDTNKGIDALYSEYEEEEYDENQNYDIDYYDETGDEVSNHNTSTNDSISVEPPRKKKLKSDTTDDTTRFANMSKKFRLGENCDSPKNVTESFSKMRN